MMNSTASRTRIKAAGIVAALGFAAFAIEGIGQIDQGARIDVQSDSPLTVATLMDKGTAPASVREQVDRILAQLAQKDYGKALELATALTRTRSNDPVGYNLQGAAYLGKKDLVNARKSFEKALSVSKNNESAHMNLAQLDLMQNDLPNARNHYQAILATDSKNVLAMLGMARLEALNKNESESLAWLERAKVADPGSPIPKLMLGTHFLRTKNYDRAIAELTEAQRLAPNNPGVLEMLGQAQAASGQGNLAVSTYQKLVSVSPKSPEAYQHLAVAQTRIADYSGATASLKKALELKPDYAEALDNLARLDVRAGRHADALKRAQQLQTVAPKSTAGLVLEGDILFDQKRFPQAAVAYQKALALTPTGILVVRLYASEVKAGKQKEAEGTLQKWLKDHPEDVTVPLYLGEEYQRTGRIKEATEQYLAVLQKEPKNVVALNNLATIYQRQNDPRAIQMAEEAFRLAPDSAAIADTLGWMLVEQGNPARGLELLQKAAAQAPKNTEIRYHLAAALAKSGEKAKARKELENLLEGSQQFPQREAAQTLLKQL